MLKSTRLILIISFTIICRIHAQQSNTLFFMHSVPQSNFLNPAVQSECRWFIGLPVISTFHINIANSGFTVNHLLGQEDGGTYSLDAERLVKKLGNRNYFSSELYTNLLAIGHRRKDYYFTFSVRERNEFILFYSKDLFAVAWRGNTQFEDDRISLKGTGIQFNHLREYAIGISKKIDDFNTYGIRGKLLFGKLNFNTRKSKGTLHTEENTFNLTFNTDVTLNASLPVSVEIGPSYYFNITDDYYTSVYDIIMNRRNWGVAFDAGFIHEYDEKITFSGSVLDLGFIYYRSNLTNYHVEGDYFYDGPLGDTIDPESYLEDLVNTFAEGSNITTNPYIYVIQPKLLLGASYKLNEKINLGALISSKIYKQKLQSGLTLSANSRFARFFTMSISWSYINRSINNLGFGMAVGRSPVQLYIISDNVPGMIWLQSTKSINIRFGLSINFGCFRREKIKGCGCYWLEKAEERRKRKEKLLK